VGRWLRWAARRAARDALVIFLHVVATLVLLGAAAALGFAAFVRWA
jgi:hypothetical protein